MTVTRRDAMAGTVGVLFAAGPRTAQAAQGDLARLHEGAKREGRMTFYCSQPPALSQRLIDSFKAKYSGVDVDLLRLSTGPLGRRFETEAGSGANVADVLQLSDPVLAASAAGKGWLASLTDLPGHAAFPAAFKTPESATVRIDPHTITYNTQNVREAEAPKTWTDVLDPRWKGRILCPDLRISIMLIYWAVLMTDSYGKDYLPKLAAQGLRWVPSQIPGSQLLGAGEADLLFPNQKQVTASFIESGAPLVDVIPGPYAGHEGVLAIPAKAPHPSAARLFGNFIMSREGAVFLNKDVSYSPLPDVPGALPIPATYKRLDAQAVVKRQAEVLELLKLK